MLKFADRITDIAAGMFSTATFLAVRQISNDQFGIGYWSYVIGALAAMTCAILFWFAKEAVFRSYNIRAKIGMSHELEGVWFERINGKVIAGEKRHHAPEFVGIIIIYFDATTRSLRLSGRAFTADSFEDYAHFDSTDLAYDERGRKLAYLYNGHLTGTAKYVKGFAELVFHGEPGGEVYEGRGFYHDMVSSEVSSELDVPMMISRVQASILAHCIGRRWPRNTQDYERLARQLVGSGTSLLERTPAR